MRQLIGILLLAALAACTSTGSNGPTPGAQTQTNCSDGSPWYWCTGYRESGR